MKIVSAARMAEIDRVSIEEYGYPGIVLMENAGIRMFDRFISLCGDRSLRLVFVAGGGNNGGDALVMARQAFFAGFKHISVILTSDKFSESAEIHRRICTNLKLPVYSWKNGETEKKEALGTIQCADVVFDGIIGTGLQGPLRGSAAEVVKEVNGCGARKIAIDAPSGIGDSFKADYPSIRADRTFTMGLPKIFLYRPAARPRCGDLEVIDIGFPPALTESESITGDFLSYDDLSGILPRMKKDAHKYTRGTVCVFAGSPGTAGAAFMTAEAAAHTRAGLVTLMLEKPLYDAAAGSFRSVMGRPWDASSNPDPAELKRFSALCVGPGWGFDTREPWLKACVASGVPGVLDADGLTLLAKMNNRPDFNGNWVLTPHPGEFARCMGQDKEALLEDLPNAVLKAAERFNAVVVLKGHVTWIGEPDGHFYVIDGMNPALGTGGSGDVLSGVLAGLLAEGLTPGMAARAAVLVHTKAGRLCFNERGWFTAEELIPYISRLLVLQGEN